MKMRLWMLLFSLMLGGLAACGGDDESECGGLGQVCCAEDQCDSGLSCATNDRCQQAGE